jgi:hypothetical protein
VRQRLVEIRRKFAYPDRPYGEMQRPVAGAQLSLAWNGAGAAGMQSLEPSAAHAAG